MFHHRDDIYRHHVNCIMTTRKKWKVVLRTKGLEDRLISSHHPQKRDAIAWSIGSGFDVKYINRDGSDKSVVVVDSLDEMARHYRKDK